MVLVVVGTIFRSGSENEVNSKLKFLRPENPESTIKRAAVAITTPKPATRVIMLIALLVLLENRYRLAMYRGSFNYAFLRFSSKSGFSIGFSVRFNDLSI